jgi:hypothetical protein
VGEGFQEAPTRSGPSGARRDACGWDRTGGCAVGPGFDGGGVDWFTWKAGAGREEERKTACRPKMLGAPALRAPCKNIVGSSSLR